MTSKFSLLSHAAAVAGILALAIPAIAAETAKPVSPSAPTPSVTAPAKQISGDAKMDAETGAKASDHKIVHAKKKHVAKSVHTVAASSKAPVAPAAKSTNTDAGKTAPAK